MRRDLWQWWFFEMSLVAKSQSVDFSELRYGNFFRAAAACWKAVFGDVFSTSFWPSIVSISSGRPLYAWPCYEVFCSSFRNGLYSSGLGDGYHQEHHDEVLKVKVRKWWCLFEKLVVVVLLPSELWWAFFLFFLIFFFLPPPAPQCSPRCPRRPERRSQQKHYWYHSAQVACSLPATGQLRKFC